MKKMKDLFMYVLAAFVMLLLFGMLFGMLFKTIPPENKELMYMAAGLALGWGTAVVQYFFGSSKGSADKTEMANNQPPGK